MVRHPHTYSNWVSKDSRFGYHVTDRNYVSIVPVISDNRSYVTLHNTRWFCNYTVVPSFPYV